MTNWGQPEDYKATLVRLHWHARRVDHGFDPAGFALNELPERPGVYAFEGRHDAHPAGCILYIGETGGKGSRTLRHRVPESLIRVGCLPSSPGKPWRPWADNWELTVRWAQVDADHVFAVEELLILAHAPPYNKQLVRGQLGADQHLIVVSAEAKGRLLPVVASVYFHNDGWPDPEA